ncbi:hypothetical protein XENTR_v10021002 [Xenopus tropicalis]|uniref:Ankyrin repeat domain-containing protein SOWAHD n=1 Tax=Xenopus tropicalis TaxID=8364 RepID=A0A803K577_XENTR|nr:ankyrin repeat domain-containing protein SOWAHD [Xenopus tropicalis]KAE8584528.1 hypothetical protein XENTR_v10021002 [Xenopus tropicalis]|eukprot:XP_017952056.1 PREDICTED: ankyrin repeat domain-containing protein SOWAHD [Xenopus tropicalis]
MEKTRAATWVRTEESGEFQNSHGGNKRGNNVCRQENIRTSSPMVRRTESANRTPSPATISRRKRGMRGSVWSTAGSLPLRGACISAASFDAIDGPEEQTLDSAVSSLVLDPNEHAWMLIAAEGNFDELKEFLWLDPSLLYKRDFVTGYSIIHWMAKHGHHEDLIKVMDFACDTGYTLDINVRDSGGLTPLHIAALQGHVMVVKVLVGAFNANIHARDHNGLKPWQYLGPGTARNLQELLGAPEEDSDVLATMNINNNCQPKNLQVRDETDPAPKLMVAIAPLQNLFKSAYGFLKKW